MCGDDISAALVGEDMTGSPPRVRGRRRCLQHGPAPDRITPRVRGRRSTASRRRRRPRITPRVRGRRPVAHALGAGERITPACAGTTTITTLAGQPVTGSPPRVRGRQLGERRGDLPCRITPACAGTTCTLGRRACWRPDHPRVCGDDTRARCPPARLTGSPPRVRGRPLKDGLRGLLRRITPACAGTTAVARANWDAVPDHPACAGTTPRCRSSGTSSTDHPRVCGDDYIPASGIYAVYGSPPHVRGRHGRVDIPGPQARITPACAGTTLRRRYRVGGAADHPRVCGDDSSRPFHRLLGDGSPPRGRGRHFATCAFTMELQ